MKEIVKKKTKYGKKVICRVSETNETTKGFFHDLVLCQDEIDFLDMGSAIDSAKYNEPIKISATCSKQRVIGSQQLHKTNIRQCSRDKIYTRKKEQMHPFFIVFSIDILV